MKAFIALLIVVFLFTGAKPASKSSAINPEHHLDKYEQLPERLDQLSEQMETVSNNVQKLK